MSTPPNDNDSAPWTASAHCASRAHCAACRGDRSFRESLYRDGRVQGIDFACPHGVSWQDAMTRATAPPGWREKARNFAASLSLWKRMGYKTVARDVYKERLATCRDCPFYRELGNLGLGECTRCGCTRAKLWLASATCPHPEGAKW